MYKVNFSDVSTGVFTGEGRDFKDDGIVGSTLGEPTFISGSGNYSATLSGTGTERVDSTINTNLPYPPPPFAFSISPKTGYVGERAEFTLTGGPFGEYRWFNDQQLFFNSYAVHTSPIRYRDCESTSVWSTYDWYRSINEIRFIENKDRGPGSFDIIFEDMKVGGGVYYLAPDAFTLIEREPTPTPTELPSLTVVSITPSEAVQTVEDVSVSVHGTGFVSGTTFQLVNTTLGTIACKSGTFTRVSDTEIRGNISLTSTKAGLYDVLVTAPSGANGRLEKGFRVGVENVSVASISPDTAILTEKDVGVTVRGTGFTSGTSFKLVNTTLGTIECLPDTITRVSSTELSGNISFGNVEEGLYDVVVTAPDGSTDHLEKGFSVDNPWFKPNPDGYQFKNPSTETITWDLFKKTYGKDEVEYPNGKPKERATSFYNDHIKTHGRGGTCFGMSATSLYVWNKNIPGEQTWNLGNNRSIDLPPWTVFTSYPDLKTLPDWIKSFHIRELDTVLLTDIQPYFEQSSSIRMAYNALNRRMEDPISYRQDPYVLSFWFGSFWSGYGGHSVVPIRIEENPDRIVIYDCNHPGQEEYLYYDSVNGGVTSPRYSNINSIALRPLSDIRKDPDIPDLTASNKWFHLAFTDSQGRHLGYQQGNFVSEIPGASRFVPTDGDGDYPETYYLGGQTLTTEVIGNGTGPGTVSIMRPNGVAVINASVRPGSKDEVRVPQSGSSVEYISGSGTDSLQLTLAMDSTDDGRQATVDGFAVDPSKTVSLSFGTNRDDVSVLNTGPAATVKFSLEQVGANPGAFVPSRSLRVEAASSVRIVPSDWTNLDDAPVRVEHDLGSDGDVDYSETFGPDVHLLPLPGCVNPPTDPNGDGLCEDVNGNGRKDFADVVLYFNQMGWIAANEPVAAFDYNGNSRIDFADVVWLFDHL